jgi:hypothetical protein
LETSKHYKILKLAFENGTIRRMNDVQGIVPITTLAMDMDMNYNTLCKRLLDPSKLTVTDIVNLSALTGMEPGVIFRHIATEVEKYNLY